VLQEVAADDAIRPTSVQESFIDCCVCQGLSEFLNIFAASQRSAMPLIFMAEEVASIILG